MKGRSYVCELLRKLAILLRSKAGKLDWLLNIDQKKTTGQVVSNEVYSVAFRSARARELHVRMSYFVEVYIVPCNHSQALCTV